MEKSKLYVDISNNKIWYLPSKGIYWLHRLDGPAVENADGSKIWYVDGKLHRIDGPAIDWGDGIKEWHIYGNELDTKEVETWIKENGIDLKTETGQVAMRLKWI